MSSRIQAHGQALCFDPDCKRCSDMMKKFVDTKVLTPIGSLKVALYHHLTSQNRLAGRVSHLQAQLSDTRFQNDRAKALRTQKSAVKDSINAEMEEAKEALNVHSELVTNIADKIRAADQERRLQVLKRDMEWYKAAGENEDTVKELEKILHAFPHNDAAELAKTPEELFGTGFPVQGVDMFGMYVPCQDRWVPSDEDDEADDDDEVPEVSLKEFLQGRPCALFDPDEPDEEVQAEEEGSDEEYQFFDFQDLAAAEASTSEAAEFGHPPDLDTVQENTELVEELAWFEDHFA